MTHIIIILPIILSSAVGSKADEWRAWLTAEVMEEGDRIEFVLREVEGEARYFLTLCIKPENFNTVAGALAATDILA